MDEVVRLFRRFGWRRRHGLHDEDVARLEADLSISFPADFRAFLRWSDGGAGFLGEAYVSILSAKDLRDANNDEFRAFFPRLVRIGGNGGLEGYCLDYRADVAHPSVVAIDLNNSAADSYWPLGTNFTQAMQSLSVAGDPWPPGADPEQRPTP